MVKVKVRLYGNGRKIVEIPKCVRDNFKEGQEVEIKRLEDGNNI